MEFQQALTIIANELGISVWLLIAIFIWSAVWKFFALWKSARKNAVIWFIVLALFNTLGLLQILYIFVFSEMKCCQPRRIKRKVKRKKRR